ncbi:MAG TPA: zf-HC2 domain-containing protein [Albitalea sp.]|nr:zf-HC2 domain-containing protein [Albitalea sp.]
MLKTLKKRLFVRSCREVSRLISDRHERPLGWHERLIVRAHLAVCGTCTRYEKQVEFLSRAMGRWRNYGDEP